LVCARRSNESACLNAGTLATMKARMRMRPPPTIDVANCIHCSGRSVGSAERSRISEADPPHAATERLVDVVRAAKRAGSRSLWFVQCCYNDQQHQPCEAGSLHLHFAPQTGSRRTRRAQEHAAAPRLCSGAPQSPGLMTQMDSRKRQLSEFLKSCRAR